MSPGDPRSLVCEIKAKLGTFVESEELENLVDRLEVYVDEVLFNRVYSDAPIKAAFEGISERLVSSGLAGETKLEDEDGVYIITATNHATRAWGQPGSGVEDVIGDVMRRLAETRTGRRYRVGVTKANRGATYRFDPAKA